MTEKLTALCPCQSGQPYQACCQPYHQQQQFPANAMLLMRSRYAAYALKNIDYIVQTTVPNQQALLPVAALQDWADKTTWVGLTFYNMSPCLKHIAKSNLRLSLLNKIKHKCIMKSLYL